MPYFKIGMHFVAFTTLYLFCMEILALNSRYILIQLSKTNSEDNPNLLKASYGTMDCWKAFTCWSDDDCSNSDCPKCRHLLGFTCYPK